MGLITTGRKKKEEQSIEEAVQKATVLLFFIKEKNKTKYKNTPFKCVKCSLVLGVIRHI